MKIKLSRPTVAGAVAASLLSVGLVGAWVPAAFAAGLNTESANRQTTGVLTTDPLQLSGTAASEVERIHVRLDDFVNNPVEFDIAMGQSAGVDPTSVAEQTWAQSVSVSDLALLNDGVITITTSFFDVADNDLADVPDFTILDLHAPTITSSTSSGQVPAGTQVTFASPDADASLFFTVSHGGTAAQPTDTDSPVTGPITVTDAMQIKVLATDFVNDVVRVLNFTVPVPAASTTTTLAVSPASPQVEGTALTLTGSESPTAAGSFEYFDGPTSLGTGASTTVTPAAGLHSYTAKFTPTNAALFTASTSGVHAVTITAKPVVVPPVVVPPVVVPPVVVPPVVKPPVVKPPVVVPPIVLPPVVKPVVKVAKLSVMRVSAAGNEFVKVKNAGQVSVNLKGYQLKDRSGHVLSLPSYTLKPGSSVKVYTGKGKAAAGKLFLKKTTNVWSTRDTASLFNTKGLRVASLRY